jgi:hypothetical protein
LDGFPTDFNHFPKCLGSEENRLNTCYRRMIFPPDASPMKCAAEPDRPRNERRYQRYEIDTQLHVTVPGVKQQKPRRGQALNISEAGIAGVFVTVWDVGTPVHLEFSVPVTQSPIRVGGVLRSQSGHCYGFEFVDLNPHQREIIGKTCRTLALLK